MGQLYTVFNNNTSLDYDLIAHFPRIEYSKEKYNEKDNLYRDSKYHIDCNSRTEIIISQEFEFVEYDLEEWQQRFREIKRWLNDIEDNELKFSDDLNFFYLVNKVEIDSPSREAYKNGKFNVTFYCDSYMYLESGKIEILLHETLMNEESQTYPLYRVVGEGLCTLKVNNKTVSINVTGNVIIDTKYRKCYRNDGTNQNTHLSGHYSDLKLLKGNNTFSVTSGFAVYITPNWRCL